MKFILNMFSQREEIERRTTRFHYINSICLKDENGKTMYATSRDISWEGMCLSTHDPHEDLTNGTFAMKVLTESGRQTICGRFEVRWIAKDKVFGGYKMGIQLRSLDQKSVINMFNIIAEVTAAHEIKTLSA